jgi:hypothetical protein
MEYAGEIITEEECERRMNEVYKDNEVSSPKIPVLATVSDSMVVLLPDEL